MCIVSYLARPILFHLKLFSTRGDLTRAGWQPASIALVNLSAYIAELNSWQNRNTKTLCVPTPSSESINLNPAFYPDKKLDTEHLVHRPSCELETVAPIWCIDLRKNPNHLIYI